MQIFFSSKLLCVSIFLCPFPCAHHQAVQFCHLVLLLLYVTVGWLVLEIKSPYLQDDSENWTIHTKILQASTVKCKSVLKHKFRLIIYCGVPFFPVENKYKSKQGAFAILPEWFSCCAVSFLRQTGLYMQI